MKEPLILRHQKVDMEESETPHAAYAAILEYVDKCLTPLTDRHVVRPFHRGGDYRKETYRRGDVVVDIPPFSIALEAAEWFMELGVDFFIGIPPISETDYNPPENPRITVIMPHVAIHYPGQTGQLIDFATNLRPKKRFEASPYLGQNLREANDVTYAEEWAAKHNDEF